ncbi:Maf-like protein [Flavobacterium sp. K77]|uniref:Maf-like protein n=1 Tax=Flavobacterium sp. K77 TaxID=2910676 RepID=UPI001F26D5D3|nr:Maf-like protein [Flavobacterium sp. K77]MCF6141356.1 Maf-like protein [Flavobacterium sp. K77]
MLKDKLKKYQIILASGSPRRQQFLKDLDLDFEIRLKDTEEVYPSHLQAHEITNYLAVLKADAFENELPVNGILITSDTIVWHKNQALGKPKNEQEAISILQSLSNSSHEVITSVCFKSNEKTTVIHEYSKVTFHNLTEETIQYYVENYKPYDKAGSYGIQEWIGFIGVAKIEGSYTNIMGLPTDKVFDYLNQLP